MNIVALTSHIPLPVDAASALTECITIVLEISAGGVPE